MRGTFQSLDLQRTDEGTCSDVNTRNIPGQGRIAIAYSETLLRYPHLGKVFHNTG
jgi:hypothetical protein